MTWLSNGEGPRRRHRHLPVPSGLAQTAKQTHRQGSCPPVTEHRAHSDTAVRSTNSLDDVAKKYGPDYSYHFV